MHTRWNSTNYWHTVQQSKQKQQNTTHTHTHTNDDLFYYFMPSICVCIWSLNTLIHACLHAYVDFFLKGSPCDVVHSQEEYNNNNTQVVYAHTLVALEKFLIKKIWPWLCFFVAFFWFFFFVSYNSVAKLGFLPKTLLSILRYQANSKKKKKKKQKKKTEKQRNYTI